MATFGSPCRSAPRNSPNDFFASPFGSVSSIWLVVGRRWLGVDRAGPNNCRALCETDCAGPSLGRDKDNK